MPLARIRREYPARALRESGAPSDPFTLFGRWLFAALRARLVEPTAVALATADARGRPSLRMVLLKGADRRGFTFYTNYRSRKGRELAARPRAALTLWWGPLHRSVRIEGRVARLPAAESDAYFALRPRGAQVAAWASPQSRTIAGRRALERRRRAIERRFAGRDVPRPPGWGGFRVVPERIEFWQGHADRLHDRLVYLRRRGRWRLVRLAP